MSVGTTAAIGIAAGIGGATSLASGALGASAAGHAADLQSQAAIQAANIQAQSAREALGFQKDVYKQQRSDMQPWLQSGQSAIKQLSSDVMNGNYKDWTGQFNAPTLADMQNDPAYQFRLQQGSKIIQQSQAARGGLLTGGTAKALGDYAQGAASDEYDKIYGRRFAEYGQRFNEFEANNTNRFNRFAALSGVGQQSATTLGNEGSQFASNAGNITINSGNAQASGINNAAAARASGIIGGANAWTGALNGGSSALQSGLLLSQLYGGGMSPYGGLSPATISAARMG